MLTHALSLLPSDSAHQCNSVDSTTCTDTTSVVCGPSYCTDISSLAKCDNSAVADMNIATELAKVKTQTCTQNTADTKCTSAWLAANINVGRNGEGGVVAAYCTDRYLVLQTTMKPGWATDMDDISQAPGGTASDGSACVTGEISATMPRLETQAFPLESVYELWSTDDDLQNKEYFDQCTLVSGETECAQATGQGDAGRYFNDGTNSYALPSDAGIGISVTGQSIYPLYSNTLQITLESCEVDSCNEHVGQGGGQPHLHGDPFSATAGKCLYSAENYTDSSGNEDLTVHPPVIGFSYDGPLIYGRYLSNAAPGFSTGLDNCGGHTHGDYAYHYHSQIIQATTTNGNKGVSKNSNTGKTYPAFVPGVFNCWKAKINDLNGGSTNVFWTKNSDKDLTAVCDGSTNYWVKDGYCLPGADNYDTCTTTATQTTTTTTTTTTDDTTATTDDTTNTDDTTTTASGASSVVASLAAAAAAAVVAM